MVRTPCCHSFGQRARIQSLVGELKSPKPRDTARNQTKPYSFFFPLHLIESPFSDLASAPPFNLLRTLLLQSSPALYAPSFGILCIVITVKPSVISFIKWKKGKPSLILHPFQLCISFLYIPSEKTLPEWCLCFPYFCSLWNTFLSDLDFHCAAEITLVSYPMIFINTLTKSKENFRFSAHSNLQ